MVAYSFQPRFAQPIVDGLKRQTIRLPRKRHARPGEHLQLYTGMRTRQCRLISRATCVSVHEIELFSYSCGLIDVTIDGHDFEGNMNDFARADGFDGLTDMWNFWNRMHGWGEFHGMLIRWEPLAPQLSGETDAERSSEKSLTR